MSLSLDLKRIIKEGTSLFRRNTVVSLASVIVTTMSMLVLSSVLLMNAVLGFSLSQLQERVDVNVYFFPDTSVSDVLTLSNDISMIPEVRDVIYVSREEAFENFKSRHVGDELIERSLHELGDNPLGASLNIRAYNPDDYDEIVSIIEENSIVSNGGLVERINYYDNKSLIERLSDFSSIARSIGYAISAFFAAIAVLVIISTLRIAIYSSKKDINVKKLVGAENRYIRGPFVVQGIIYGIISSLICIAALFPITVWINNYTESFFGGVNVALYYQTNVLPIFIIIFSCSVLIGIIASTISIKKHLKV